MLKGEWDLSARERGLSKLGGVDNELSKKKEISIALVE